MRMYAVLFVAGTFLLSACKPPAQQAATLKDDTSAPAGDRCNLAKTKAESDKAALDQLECVSKIVDAVGPAWVKAVKAAVELGVAINELQALRVDLSEDPADGQAPSGPAPAPAPAPGDQQAQAPAPAPAPSDAVTQAPAGEQTGFDLTGSVPISAWELINNLMTEISQRRAITPRWLGRCVATVTDTSSGLADLAKGVKELSEKKSLDLAGIKTLIEAVGGGTIAMFQLGNAINSCAPPAGAKEAVASMRRTIGKMNAGFEGLKSALGSIEALAVCGVNITRGLIVLANNTSCLMDDLAALKASEADLQRARDRLLSQSQPNPGGDYTKRCNQEPNNCNQFLFAKYGEWARRNVGTFTTRRGACADMCGNGGPRRGECRQNAAQFLEASDREACTGICDETQCDAAIAKCISLCCGQDGSCAKAADNSINVDTQPAVGAYSRAEKRATGRAGNYQVRCDLGRERCDIPYIDYKVIESTIHVNINYKCPSYYFSSNSGYVGLGNNAAPVKAISDEISRFNANNNLSLVHMATLASYVIPGGTGGFQNCAADQ